MLGCYENNVTMPNLHFIDFSQQSHTLMLLKSSALSLHTVVVINDTAVL